MQLHVWVQLESGSTLSRIWWSDDAKQLTCLQTQNFPDALTLHANQHPSVQCHFCNHTIFVLHYHYIDHRCALLCGSLRITLCSGLIPSQCDIFVKPRASVLLIELIDRILTQSRPWGRGSHSRANFIEGMSSLNVNAKCYMSYVGERFDFGSVNERCSLESGPAAGWFQNITVCSWSPALSTWLPIDFFTLI